MGQEAFDIIVFAGFDKADEFGDDLARFISVLDVFKILAGDFFELFFN